MDEMMRKGLQDAARLASRVRAEMGRILVGQDELVTRLLVALLANGHVLVEGVPGLAKTTAIRALAQTLGGSFARLQFTPDLLPADIVGTQIYDPRDHSFSVRRGPVFANLVLADEINRSPAKVQSALLEAMQERQVTIGGETHQLPSPFLVMATQNPIEQEGTYPLPEAQVDRFLLKVELRYPQRAQEAQILTRMAKPSVDFRLDAVAGLDELLALRPVLERLHLDEMLAEYILDLVIATRPGERHQLSERQRGARLDDFDSWVQYGASPRATLALALCAKAIALLSERDYVVPQDVKDIAPDVLRHRLVPSYEAEAEGLTANALIRRLLDELRTP